MGCRSRGGPFFGSVAGFFIRLPRRLEFQFFGNVDGLGGNFSCNNVSEILGGGLGVKFISDAKSGPVPDIRSVQIGGIDGGNMLSLEAFNIVNVPAVSGAVVDFVAVVRVVDVAGSNFAMQVCTDSVLDESISEDKSLSIDGRSIDPASADGKQNCNFSSTHSAPQGNVLLFSSVSSSFSLSLTSTKSPDPFKFFVTKPFSGRVESCSLVTHLDRSTQSLVLKKAVPKELLLILKENVFEASAVTVTRKAGI